MTRDRGVSRRALLGAAGAGTALGAASATGAWQLGDNATTPGSWPFHGEHQAGITTPAQDRLHFAAFDVTTTARSQLVALLRSWSRAAALMTRGRQVGGSTPAAYDAPPADTGEALGLPPAGLTLTFGFGPSLFRDDQGRDTFGLAERRPAALRGLPQFPGDHLNPARSHGDLCVQACADDPQVAVHAIRNLTRIAFGTAALRWAQLGFGRASTSTTQQTPRNLFGFKDGTNNLKAEQANEVDDHVWVGRGDDASADWLTGGSYLVARRINMFIEPWDRTSLAEQEQVIGRDRPEGAPLSGGTEFTPPNFHRRGHGGGPLMPPDSHVRLAHPSRNHGVRILRRGYNFTDGSDALGRLDAGLFFIAFVRDPWVQFVPLQTRLARSDAMSEYIQHTGSAIFAIPPGISPQGFVGQGLFT